MSYKIHAKGHIFLSETEAKYLPLWKVFVSKLFAIPIQKRYWFVAEVSIITEERIRFFDIVIDDMCNKWRVAWISEDFKTIRIENISPLYAWKGSFFMAFYANSQPK